MIQLILKENKLHYETTIYGENTPH